MNIEWNRNAPIERQLRDRAVAMILEGNLVPGDPLPAVRDAAADLRVNPLTVARVYQQLLAEELVEHSGNGRTFVSPGAPEILRTTERQRFLRECWPAITACMQRLGLEPPALQQAN